MTRHLIPLYLAVLVSSTTAAPAVAQQPAPLPMAFPAPAPGLRERMDVTYATAAGTRLAMDVYRPAATSAPASVPALVFFNRATGAERSGPFYQKWARTAASRGIVGILPDLREGSEAADFKLLIAHLEQHASEYGIGSIAVYAGSGNVYNAFPAVEDPAMTAVKAAVMYYGTVDLKQFRLDLPVLYVRAGLDRPQVNQWITDLAARAVTQNAPLTLLNYPAGQHAFEIFDDTDATRQVIEQTLQFVKAATGPAYQASLRATLPQAQAGGYVQTGRFHEAAASYGSMLAARPDDSRLRLAYGEALLGDKQYEAACAEFDKLRGKGLGYRDLGIPAAEACLKKGDPAAAIAWLATIPARFLPASTAQDPRFAGLKDREDFHALFKRQ